MKWLRLTPTTMLQDFLSHLFLLCLPRPPKKSCPINPVPGEFCPNTTNCHLHRGYKKHICHISFRCKNMPSSAYSKWISVVNQQKEWAEKWHFTGYAHWLPNENLWQLAPRRLKSLQGTHHTGHFLQGTKGQYDSFRVWPPLLPTFYPMRFTLKITLSLSFRNSQDTKGVKYIVKWCKMDLPIIKSYMMIWWNAQTLHQLPHWRPGRPCPYPAAVNESPRAKMVTLLSFTSTRNSWRQGYGQLWCLPFRTDPAGSQSFIRIRISYKPSILKLHSSLGDHFMF